jgi:hypothetical protein
MSAENQIIKTRKLVFELEVTGNDEEFAFCEKICESFINFVRKAVRVTAIDKRIKWTAFTKPMPPKKSHAQVQLPQVNRNGQAKQPCIVK